VLRADDVVRGGVEHDPAPVVDDPCPRVGDDRLDGAVESARRHLHHQHPIDPVDLHRPRQHDRPVLAAPEGDRRVAALHLGEADRETALFQSQSLQVAVAAGRDHPVRGPREVEVLDPLGDQRLL
jgi:hypothetical protein